MGLRSHAFLYINFFFNLLKEDSEMEKPKPPEGRIVCGTCHEEIKGKHYCLALTIAFPVVVFALCAWSFIYLVAYGAK